MNQYKAGTFLRQGLRNGMLETVPRLARITFKFCKSHGSSQAMREFIETEIVDFARQCPTTVVYLKPRRHRDPIVVAEYINGHREELRCNPFSKPELVKWVDYLRTSSGATKSKILRYQATDSVSIQGPWNPWTYRPTEDYLEHLPNEKFSMAKRRSLSATEELLERAKVLEMQ